MKRIFFLNAGDPDWRTSLAALFALDRAGADWVELCVPYANPFTDGEVIQASHRRAMNSGVDVHFVLRQLRELRRHLALKVALMVDWKQSIADAGTRHLVRDAAMAGADALLAHGLPPRERSTWNAACRDHGVARVQTIYPGTELGAQDWENLAFVYLVSRYGRAGGGGLANPTALTDCVGRVRMHTDAPVFFGFGIDGAPAVRQAARCGADGVIVGSHFVDWLHRTAQAGQLGDAAVKAYADGFRSHGRCAVAVQSAKQGAAWTSA